MGDFAKENFVSEQDGAFFANLYKNAGLKGGHIIMLNSAESEYYKATKEQAFTALKAYPGGLQIGGGINPENAAEFLDAGASHVIVTSYVFKGGMIHFDRLQKMADAVGKEHLVLDLSCKKTTEGYMIVTDRWQNITKEEVSIELFDRLSAYCDEFLVHAVDVEGKADGIEEELTRMMGKWRKKTMTYAGGVHNLRDIELIKKLGQNHINVTVGSALDLFGGELKWQDVIEICRS